MATGRDWPNLARQVRERREELGLTQEDVAQRGGPSTATQREIERAKPMRKRPSSYRNLEKALELREGSAMRALLGGQVQRLEEPLPPQHVPGRRYADAALQRIWEIDALPENVREVLIGVVDGIRAGNDQRRDA